MDAVLISGIVGGVSALFGAAIGGIVTVWVTRLNSRKDLELRKLESEARRQELGDNERRSEREFRRDKYATFIGAYHQALGHSGRIRRLLEKQPTDWSAQVTKIANSQEFAEALDQLNGSTQWIELLTQDPEGLTLADKLDDAHNAYTGELSDASIGGQRGEAIDLVAIKERFEALNKVFDELRDLLRGELSKASP